MTRQSLCLSQPGLHYALKVGFRYISCPALDGKILGQRTLTQGKRVKNNPKPACSTALNETTLGQSILRTAGTLQETVPHVVLLFISEPPFLHRTGSIVVDCNCFFQPDPSINRTVVETAFQDGTSNATGLWLGSSYQLKELSVDSM